MGMSNTDKAKKPKFTLGFKQDAAKLVLEKGYTHQQAADSLGVSLSALGRWVRAERQPATVAAGKSPPLNLAEQSELIRLRKEVEQLRMEREIIKKAAVFFAKELG
jgi:transposase